MDFRWLEKILRKIVRYGEISKVNYSTGTVRVTFPDTGIQSGEYLVLTPRTSKDKFWNMPCIDEAVVCLCSPFSNNKGIVLGSYYQAKDTPPASDNRIKYLLEDENFLEYNRETKTLKFKSDNIVFESSSKITCTTPLVECSTALTTGGTIGAGENISAPDVETSKGSVNAHIHNKNTSPTTAMNE
ncbi:phage baseplate assembly protein V [Ilyobacter polytropus]|uniref:Phage baseplate assembly protein V n=1 Tax=Ilyobacter polytropus (strain ATCC 51220 / DSM 2926 / LMG 16218 / CuHBu1) TaxID=572544 RepID=E3HBK9_ILYPC|nr:phage baseplate assembly protein V [Ilyobacter polytropus]ADO83705.1 phage baseplate assembly protein V [Ilyobacter polytropus DSM 2926]